MKLLKKELKRDNFNTLYLKCLIKNPSTISTSNYLYNKMSYKDL